MKSYPRHPKFEDGNHASYEFDPQADFYQFLEEAKSDANQRKSKAVPTNVEQVRKTVSDGEKRNRKSWKSWVFSWLKKTKTMDAEPSSDKARRKGIVSGPIQTSSASINSRSRKATSGPLMSLFNPSKKEDDGIVPYMCLNHLNSPHHATTPHTYGPVYLVT